MSFHRFRPAPMAPLVLALLVGACGWAKAPTNESGVSETTATTASFGGKLLPGLYKVVQTGDVAMEDEECLTPEQIAKDEIAPSDSLQEGWRFVRNRMSGGRYEMEAAGPANARIVSNGTYDATSYTGDFAMHFTQDGKPQTIKIGVKATRIADSCKKDAGGDAGNDEGEGEGS